MNESKTAVLCDSGCDVGRKAAAEYGITIIPLIVNYKARSISDLDLLEEDPLYVYKHFKEEIPKTSALNIQEVLDVAEKLYQEGYRNFITVSISSRMSSTFNAMSCAMVDLEDRHPDVKTFAFDTRNISIGSGVFAIYAGYMLQKGTSFDEVCRLLQAKIGDVNLQFFMDTLTYLRIGGRITPAVEVVGNLLQLKPIIKCNEEGVYYTTGKVRGSQRAVEKLFSQVVTDDCDPENDWFMIMNGDGRAYADKAKEMLLAKYPAAKIIIDQQIVPTMAINTGPGLLGLCHFKVK